MPHFSLELFLEKKYVVWFPFVFLKNSRKYLGNIERIIQIHDYAGENDTIHAVKKAAVPGHKIPRFFNTRITLQQRLYQISDLTEDTDKDPQEYRLSITQRKPQRRGQGKKQADDDRPE